MKTRKPEQIPNYEIRIKGPLGKEWSGWFDDMEIIFEEDGNTLIAGPVIDQAALYGLLKRIHRIGLQLISINEIDCMEIKKQEKETIKK